jgi:cytochrome c-type biogenesis protein CcmH
MIGFWLAAGVLAGATALLVMLAARRAETDPADDPALSLHRRQLAEIDDLVARGLLNPKDEAAVRAEAARRLIGRAEAAGTPETRGSPAARRIALAAAVLGAALAVGLYVFLGAAGAPDQPYRQRVAAWRRSDPASLDARELLAVLGDMARQRPNDPQVFAFLGRAALAAGDPFAARKAYARAIALSPPAAPSSAALQAALGEALAEEAAARGEGAGENASSQNASSQNASSQNASGQNASGPTPGRDAARAAFRRALALDPKSPEALFALGRLEIEAGRRAEGVVLWRTLLAELPPADPRRAALAAAADRVAAGGPVEAPAPAGAAAQGPLAAGETGAFIRGMVARLAAKLDAAPNDPEGWARLVRAYGVLHDKPAQDAALKRARALFAARPAVLAPIEAEAAAHPAG